MNYMEVVGFGSFLFFFKGLDDQHLYWYSISLSLLDWNYNLGGKLSISGFHFQLAQ